MAGNTVTLTFAGDSKSLERSLNNVGTATNTMAGKVEASSSKLESFGSKFGEAGEKADGAHTKFMGTADTLDGLSTIMGFNISHQIQMARGFADLADGLGSTVLPAIEGLIGKIGVWTGLTEAQSVAEDELAASSDAAAVSEGLALGPILLIIAAVAAVGVAS